MMYRASKKTFSTTQRKIQFCLNPLKKNGGPPTQKNVGPPPKKTVDQPSKKTKKRVCGLSALLIPYKNGYISENADLGDK